MTYRNVTATYRGRTYEIPEIWMAVMLQRKPPEGFLPLSIPDVIAWWAYQVELEEQFQREQEEAQA